MKSLRRYLVTLMATTSLVTIVLLVTGWGSAIAAQVSSVVVTNSASQPVPVAQQGTASVNVANTVQVNPGVVSTKAADNPAFQAFKTKGLAAESNGGEGLLDTNTYTVPAGKELVVESVSFRYLMPSSESPTEIEIESGGVASPN